MYIVWKIRTLTRYHCDACGSYRERKAIRSLIPVLVENRRVGGKPKQLHIARFPAIRSSCLTSPAARALWWRKAERMLSRIDEKDRKVIRQKLAVIIPLPDKKEVETHTLPRTLNEALHILNLSWPAARAEVKAAFRPLAKEHHPDHGGTSSGFRAVYAAYMKCCSLEPVRSEPSYSSWAVISERMAKASSRMLGEPLLLHSSANTVNACCCSLPANDQCQ
jgi:hypothetical protein